MKGLRLTALAVVLGFLVAPAGAGTTAAGRSLASRSSLGHGIVAEMNTVRLAHGLPALRPSPALATAAKSHSFEMARKGYFAHESANGGEFWKRVERYYGSKGYRSWRVGENLVWASPDLSAKLAVDLWLKSPEHRRILLTRSWREVGLAAVHAPLARGAYGNRPVTIVTADFGFRLR